MRLLLWQTECSGKVSCTGCGRAILVWFYANWHTHVCMYVRRLTYIHAWLRACWKCARVQLWKSFGTLSAYCFRCSHIRAHTHLNTQLHLKKYTYANFISHVNLCDFIFFNDYSACGGGVCCLSAAQCGSSSRFVLILLRKKQQRLLN